MKFKYALIIISAVASGCVSDPKQPIDFTQLEGTVMTVTNSWAVSRIYLGEEGKAAAYHTDINGSTSEGKGIWRMATNGDLCMTITEPLPATQFRHEKCSPIPVNNYGEKWYNDDPRNGKITLQLDIKQEE